MNQDHIWNTNATREKFAFVLDHHYNCSEVGRFSAHYAKGSTHIKQTQVMNGLIYDRHHEKQLCLPNPRNHSYEKSNRI